MTATEGSAAFEPCEDDNYFQTPSPKRSRIERSSNGAEHSESHQIMHVSEVLETGNPGEVDTITVPSSQFEIEINSQVDDENGDEIPQIQRSDLTGPAFDIVHDPQELGLADSSRMDDGCTLTAIGRALLQMQQGSGQNHQLLNQPSSISASPNQQIFFTRASSSSEQSKSSPNSTAPLYVMIPPASSAEILHAMGQTRPIAPKTTSPPLELNPQESVDPKLREAQRKATHNEVERRRRDRINELIKMLAMIVPGCQKKDATTGTIVGYVYSKGTVLDKTVEYLKELITQNEQLAGTAKLAEKSASALSLVQNQISVLEKENAFLRAQIIQFGIDAAASSNSASQQIQSQQQQKASILSGNNRQVLNSPLTQSLLNTVAQTSQQSTAMSRPPPPPPPAESNSTATAHQLLISLAQSLTNSPLLTSLTHAQASTVPPTISYSPSHITTSPSISGIASLLPTIGSMSAAMTTPTPPQTQLQQNPIAPPPVQSVVMTTSTAAASSSPPQVSPLLSSLVQTLASLANTSIPATPIPKVSPTRPQTPPQTGPVGGGGGLSAAAAANLLNTLIMAQNVLTSSGVGGASSGQSLSSSVLGNLALEGVRRGEQ